MSKQKTDDKQLKIVRDEKGDLKTGDEPFDWKNFRWWAGTHVFHYFTDYEGRSVYLPFFELHQFMNDKLETARLHSDYLEKILFESPETPEDKEKWDASIAEHNYSLQLFIQYFKEVFDEESFAKGHLPQFKYSRIILPGDLYEKIENVIEEYGLSRIHDLIFEIIAVAQHIYINDVFNLENSGYEKRIKNIEKEAKTVSEILKREVDSNWEKGTLINHPRLEHINFVYQDGTKRIKDPWLMKDILEQFKDHLEHDGPLKDWKKEMERYPLIYRDIEQKLQFKYQLAISLYNLLTKEKFIEASEKAPFPNKVVNCIAQIMDFCLIPLGKNDALLEDKRMNVRSWLIRKEMEQRITNLPVQPDTERMLKYFKEEFVNITGLVKSADVISFGRYLQDRFELPEKLIPDMCHISQALKEIRFLLGHQLSLQGSSKKDPFEDYTALRILVESVKQNKKISTLKFKIDGDEKEYQFTERLPHYLIEQALRIHAIEHELDFELDIQKGKVIQASPGQYQFNKENKFHLPSEQFAARFVKALYNYLLNEFPPAEKEMSPSQRYYAIIAAILHQAGFFNGLSSNDNFILDKVDHWHSLTPDS